MVNVERAERTADERANPLAALVDEGQSVWLDNITRDFVRGGELKRLVEEDGLRGLTSNPTIFQKAIAAGDAYDEQMRGLVAEGKDAGEIFEALAVTDIREACDVFRPLYDAEGGADGFVSLEVSPSLARDTEATLEEARRLWRSVDRPNLMIKVPGTDEGAPAVRRLLTEGINVNVTLLFSIENHERVMWAYIEALEERLGRGEAVDRLASVASFFISRVDTLVDGLLDEKIERAGDGAERERLRGLKGKAAIANAKLAYARFREVFGGERFGELAERGASVQRPLWGSTSVKDPEYRDVLYVEELIGPDTVNTVPPETFQAFLDHGRVRRTVDEDVEGARRVLGELAAVSIDYGTVTRRLEDEGVRKFADSYDELIEGVEGKRERMRR